jgi:hypothetical protein
MDETAAFLADILQESTEDYDTEEATAMMMNDALLLDDTTSVSTRIRSPPHEVPRLSLDENRGNQKHVEGEHGAVRPEAGSNLGVPSTHEVPRLPLDGSQGDQIHVGRGHKLERPATSQAPTGEAPSPYVLITDGSQFQRSFLGRRMPIPAGSTTKATAGSTTKATANPTQTHTYRRRASILGCEALAYREKDKRAISTDKSMIL